EHLATFADPADKVVAELTHTRPDRTSGVHADPIGANAVGPYPTVREASVGGDVERRQPSGEGLRDDQRRVIGRGVYLSNSGWTGPTLASAHRREHSRRAF